VSHLCSIDMEPTARPLDWSRSRMTHALVCSISVRCPSSIHGHMEPRTATLHRLPWPPRCPVASSSLHRNNCTMSWCTRTSTRLHHIDRSLLVWCSFGSTAISVRPSTGSSVWASATAPSRALRYNANTKPGSSCLRCRHEQLHRKEQRYGLDF
jgi:hypothetical protein